MTTTEQRLWYLILRVLLDYSRNQVFVGGYDQHTRPEVVQLGIDLRR